MWIDEKRRMHTLEQDIQEIWDKHGWKVIQETVQENTWIIKAIRKRQLKGIYDK